MWKWPQETHVIGHYHWIQHFSLCPYGWTFHRSFVRWFTVNHIKGHRKGQCQRERVTLTLRDFVYVLFNLQDWRLTVDWTTVNRTLTISRHESLFFRPADSEQESLEKRLVNCQLESWTVSLFSRTGFIYESPIEKRSNVEATHESCFVLSFTVDCWRWKRQHQVLQQQPWNTLKDGRFVGDHQRCSVSYCPGSGIHNDKD